MLSGLWVEIDRCAIKDSKLRKINERNIVYLLIKYFRKVGHDNRKNWVKFWKAK